MLEVGALVGPTFAAVGAGGTPAGGGAPNPPMAGVPVARMSAPADPTAPPPWHLSGSIAIAHYFMQKPPSAFYAKLPDYISIGAPWLPVKSSTRSFLA